MLPPPPTSPLFPYTTLFRSPRAGVRTVRQTTKRSHDVCPALFPGEVGGGLIGHATWGTQSQQRSGRSEEHTSELQSRPHLVCRLLLEKKKENINTDAIDQ